MTAVAISQTTPGGTDEVVGVPITFHLEHASGIDTATIALTLVDPQGDTHSPIAAGAFDTSNDWNGRRVADGATGYDIVVDQHAPLQPGPWTATATADSSTGGEDGTASWTFQVVAVISGVLQAIVDILEGSAGTTRTVPADYFRHIDFDSTEMGAVGAAGPTRPFDIRIIAPASDPTLSDFVSGDYVQDATTVRVTVLYAAMPNSSLALEKTIGVDQMQIIRALEWPENWCATSGWIGCEVTGVTREELGEEEQAQVVAMNYDLLISTREKHG